MIEPMNEPMSEAVSSVWTLLQFMRATAPGKAANPPSQQHCAASRRRRSMLISHRKHILQSIRQLRRIERFVQHEKQRIEHI